MLSGPRGVAAVFEVKAQMVVLVAYDVNTMDRAGRKRLRRVAKACLDYGQRVQYSVFECTVGDKEWVLLRSRLVEEIDAKLDSLRFYFLDVAAVGRIEHVGIKEPRDLSEPLVF
jgi:CRISPR-associated protein Cas2